MAQLDLDDFIARIASAGADEELWRVYADWLQEHGEPTRGRCIALELSLDAAAGDLEQQRVLRRERDKLMRDERHALLGPALMALELRRGSGVAQCRMRFRRGFIDSARLTLAHPENSRGADSDKRIYLGIDVLMKSKAARHLRELTLLVHDEQSAERHASGCVLRLATFSCPSLRRVTIECFDERPRDPEAGDELDIRRHAIQSLYDAHPRLEQLACLWADGEATFDRPALEPRIAPRR
ncbi:MAG: TIGR02996 domain-containing protein [Myxococcales bacterium]|nr:TIGR02996 domain-containing protein [Myxococcales bacterium]